MIRLRESLLELGHVVHDDIWDAKKIKEIQADLVIIAFTLMFHEKRKFIPLSLKLKKAGIPLATWNLDSPWNIKSRNTWRLNLILFLGMIDIYATHSLQNTGWIKGTKVLYLPNAAWVSRYNLHGSFLSELVSKKDYDYDVSFVGNLNKDSYPEHSARVKFLEKLALLLEKEGIKYMFIDSFREKSLSISQQIELIQNSKINLSCVAAVDSTGVRSWGLTERAYGIPACGGFLLMEHRHHASDDFSIDKEIAMYDGSLEDCLEKIKYYLEHETERKTILANAHARVMKDHTYLNRVKTLLNAIPERYN